MSECSSCLLCIFSPFVFLSFFLACFFPLSSCFLACFFPYFCLSFLLPLCIACCGNTALQLRRSHPLLGSITKALGILRSSPEVKQTTAVKLHMRGGAAMADDRQSTLHLITTMNCAVLCRRLLLCSRSGMLGSVCVVKLVYIGFDLRSFLPCSCPLPPVSPAFAFTHNLLCCTGSPMLQLTLPWGLACLKVQPDSHVQYI